MPDNTPAPHIDASASALEYRVIGPPGAGKTTWVKNEVAARVAKGYAPTDIVLTSFTKAAAVVFRFVRG